MGCDVSSCTGRIWPPVVTRARAAGLGVDHRPGRGSELLRRRLPCHDSSSVEAAGMAGRGDRVVPGVLLVSPFCCDCCERSVDKFACSNEGRRWRRMDGRRERSEAARCRGYDVGPGEGVADGGWPSWGAGEPLTGSMGSIEAGVHEESHMDDGGSRGKGREKKVKIQEAKDESENERGRKG